MRRVSVAGGLMMRSDASNERKSVATLAAASHSQSSEAAASDRSGSYERTVSSIASMANGVVSTIVVLQN